MSRTGDWDLLGLRESLRLRLLRLLLQWCRRRERSPERDRLLDRRREL